MVDLDTLRRHRLRGGLSALGVTLAVAVVLAVGAINGGAQRAALREVERLGVATIVVRSPATGGSLTLADAEELARLLPGAAVSATLEVRLPVTGAAQAVEANVVGVTAAYHAVRQLRAAAGRLTHDSDDADGARVCVLGHETARRLFAHRPPLDGHVRLAGQWYRVVGILPADRGEAVHVPLSSLTLRRTSADPGQRTSAVWVRVPDPKDVDRPAAVIRAALARKVRVGSRYEVVVARELLNTRDRTQRLFSALATATAVLLFLVGGSGIANAMLTAVIERTPEIGLRRAVGASRRDIATQFVFEAAVISLSGGIAGVAVGVMLAAVVGRYSGWPTALSASAIPLALAVALLLGVLAGLYPAVRASRVPPIDALTHE